MAAKKTLEMYGDSHTIRVVNNPILEEDKDNIRFLKDAEQWLGVKIEIYTNPKYPQHSARDVWEKRKFMSSPYGAPCTQELKRSARQLWESENDFCFLVMGFTSEEKDRYERFKLTERGNCISPLVELNISKKECFSILEREGILLPISYRLGFKNANCIGCVKSSSIPYWQLVREKYPDVFQDRSEQSRRLGAKLIKIGTERRFLDELPSGIEQYSLEFENSVECGIFCEERE